MLDEGLVDVRYNPVIEMRLGTRRETRWRASWLALQALDSVRIGDALFGAEGTPAVCVS